MQPPFDQCTHAATFGVMRTQPDEYEVSTDRARLDLETIHRFLSNEAYWSPGVARQVVERSVERSMCFGVYRGDEQVGFARVVTDGATFAWLADVFIVSGHRGRGLGKRLVAAVLQHPDLQGLRRWMLGTADAHELYRRFGFSELQDVDRFMALESGAAARDCGG
jgi:GNAT superfamily N-acetyltransferase